MTEYNRNSAEQTYLRFFEDDVPKEGAEIDIHRFLISYSDAPQEVINQCLSTVSNLIIFLLTKKGKKTHCLFASRFLLEWRDLKFDVSLAQRVGQFILSQMTSSAESLTITFNKDVLEFLHVLASMFTPDTTCSISHAQFERLRAMLKGVGTGSPDSLPVKDGKARFFDLYSNVASMLPPPQVFELYTDFMAEVERMIEAITPDRHCAITELDRVPMDPDLPCVCLKEGLGAGVVNVKDLTRKVVQMGKLVCVGAPEEAQKIFLALLGPGVERLDLTDHVCTSVFALRCLSLCPCLSMVQGEEGSRRRKALVDVFISMMTGSHPLSRFFVTDLICLLPVEWKVEIPDMSDGEEEEDGEPPHNYFGDALLTATSASVQDDTEHPLLRWANLLVVLSMIIDTDETNLYYSSPLFVEFCRAMVQIETDIHPIRSNLPYFLRELILLSGGEEGVPQLEETIAKAIALARRMAAGETLPADEYRYFEPIANIIGDVFTEEFENVTLTSEIVEIARASLLLPPLLSSLSPLAMTGRLIRQPHLLGSETCGDLVVLAAERVRRLIAFSVHPDTRYFGADVETNADMNVMRMITDVKNFSSQVTIMLTNIAEEGEALEWLTLQRAVAIAGCVDQIHFEEQEEDLPEGEVFGVDPAVPVRSSRIPSQLACLAEGLMGLASAVFYTPKEGRGDADAEELDDPVKTAFFELMVRKLNQRADFLPSNYAHNLIALDDDEWDISPLDVATLPFISSLHFLSMYGPGWRGESRERSMVSLYMLCYERFFCSLSILLQVYPTTHPYEDEEDEKVDRMYSVFFDHVTYLLSDKLFQPLTDHPALRKEFLLSNRAYGEWESMVSAVIGQEYCHHPLYTNAVVGSALMFALYFIEAYTREGDPPSRHSNFMHPGMYFSGSNVMDLFFSALYDHVRRTVLRDPVNRAHKHTVLLTSYVCGLAHLGQQRSVAKHRVAKYLAGVLPDVFRAWDTVAEHCVALREKEMAGICLDAMDDDDYNDLWCYDNIVSMYFTLLAKGLPGLRDSLSVSRLEEMLEAATLMSVDKDELEATAEALTEFMDSNPGLIDELGLKDQFAAAISAILSAPVLVGEEESEVSM
eukprot:gnl/Dysnectes_brevis/5348_a7649_359.p1 GENE.gnl/Dysnectes_brevis/5348_a7649_359~~gnl/Dysnectes_brevis/5348_a7649_359.p1  ORF type:complete len:1099 (-),score=343.60 gnl/Dysnectes_brevis/5348_a7649_359:57-3353(-)